jgi:hypothetical protein
MHLDLLYIRYSVPYVQITSLYCLLQYFGGAANSDFQEIHWRLSDRVNYGVAGQVFHWTGTGHL